MCKPFYLVRGKSALFPGGFGDKSHAGYTSLQMLGAWGNKADCCDVVSCGILGSGCLVLPMRPSDRGMDSSVNEWAEWGVSELLPVKTIVSSRHLSRRVSFKNRNRCCITVQ